MAPYIGTSTSRVDGVAKVTGAAKYAAEFNVPGLAYGSVVTSTIANGRISVGRLPAVRRVSLNSANGAAIRGAIHPRWGVAKW